MMPKPKLLSPAEIEAAAAQRARTSVLSPGNLPDIEKSDRKLAGLRHLERLAKAMAPDPMEWEYRGEVTDSGFGMSLAACSCGHPIRYIFTVRHKPTGRGIPIGSVCIGTSVPYLIAHGNEPLAKALEAAVEKLKAEIAEAERRERDARNDADVSACLTDWAALVAWRTAAVAAYPSSWKPEGLWKAWKKPKTNTTPGRTLSSLVKMYVTHWRVAAQVRARENGQTPRHSDRAFVCPVVPVPAHPKLVEALKKALAEDAVRLERRIEGAKPWAAETWGGSYKHQINQMTVELAAVRQAETEFQK